MEENRRAIRREQARLRRLQRKHHSRYGLTEETLLLCATMKELAPDEPEIARWAAQRSLADPTEAQDCVRACLIDDVIDECRREHLAGVQAQSDGAAANTNRRQRAADLIAQHRLMTWVRHVNIEQGIAPSSDQMLQQLKACWTFQEQPDLTNTAEKISTGSSSGTRRWLTDWRRRFGITFGRLPPGCDLTPEVIENQVSSPERGSKNEPIFGTQFWVPKRPPKTCGTRFRNQIRYPFLEPRNQKVEPVLGAFLEPLLGEVVLDMGELVERADAG